MFTIEADHHKYLPSPYFKQMKDGYKKSEGQINKIGSNNYVPGEIIRFYNHTDGEFYVRIIGVTEYPNFEDMIKNELHNVLPFVNSIEEGIKIYRNLYPNIVTEYRLGVIVVEVELI